MAPGCLKYVIAPCENILLGQHWRCRNGGKTGISPADAEGTKFQSRYQRILRPCKSGRGIVLKYIGAAKREAGGVEQGRRENVSLRQRQELVSAQDNRREYRE